MFSKIIIRNIPDQIFRALETLAAAHNRSTEGEARQALQAWAEPILVEENRNTRRKEVAERLNRMLTQVNSARRGKKLTTSHIAENIREDRAEEVEDWFLGVKEPSFSQLTAIATLLGVDAEWLKHGDESLYPTEYIRLSENPFEAVEWLLDWEANDKLVEGKLKTLHLIRADNKEGNFYIVKESDQGHFRNFHTSIHISEEIGAGGETTLAALFVTLELLYKRYTTMGFGIMVLGHQVHPDDIKKLLDGNTNPLSLLRDGSRSMWWEDIWDNKMAPKNSYWQGWKQLYERIEKVISYRTNLDELRARIRQGATTMAEDIDNGT